MMGPLIAVLIFVVALLVGSGINWAVYTLAFRARPISPWSLPPEHAVPRTWLDCVPLYGWWRLRREEHLHGRWFWVRPILIEAVYGAGMVWLFHFETTGGLLPPIPLSAPLATSYWYPMFAAHAALIALLTAATFIDFDEQTIPDTVTLPGTLLLLLVMTIWPTAHLPVIYFGVPLPGVATVESLLLTSRPAVMFPAEFMNWPGLALALTIVWLWWLAIVPGTLTFRRGPLKAAQFYIASIIRHGTWWRLGILFVLISLAVTGTWLWGGTHWQSLLTSLAGLAFAGGLVWGVRIGGSIGLQQEAMGFGDVTLMAMIGVVVGWQASLLVFFLSPAAAVFVALTQFIITRRKDIAFGPYLSLATVIVIVAWRGLWEGYARGIFELGALVPIAIAFFLLAMTGMLMVWRLIRDAIWARIEGH
ncbi:Type IV leader peptidase family protein [Anatilimnocola aggregata]|uniref:Type IV leader peptidase family protein n=1 Tax=Anatilimnocola aggregata TaxID=2528021 RepID=A0A517Y664_9BACT|nr:A24 family peptidase [Anatilimnocola aggregata]QDU25622.1 Type IV leader peptidase family protein [Anatilimnocola aggregata]